jgi:hypothetical protein
MERTDALSSRTGIAALAALAVGCMANSPAAAQGFIDFLRSSGSTAYAPAPEQLEPAKPVAPLSIVPASPRIGDVAPASRNGRSARPPVVTPVPTGNPFEEDEDADVVFEHDVPKLVRVPLPEPRPGARPAEAAEVAPVGEQRWQSADEYLPPNAQLPGAEQAPPPPPRLASLPGTGPSWTATDLALRPPGLRQSEAPVAAMPGVFAPPEAVFGCLPDSLKQVLLDTAREFGHVAILNARRPRGTGARASYHYQCRAVDFRVRGVPIATVYAYLRQHPGVGGRKIYPFGFFHIDDGPSRSW